MKEIITNILVVLIAGATFYLFLGYAIDAHEIKTCNTLELQSKKHAPLFYITKLEKQMCDAHDIIINAPVK